MALWRLSYVLPLNNLKTAQQVDAAKQAPQLDTAGPDLQLLDYLGLELESHTATLSLGKILRTIIVNTTPRFDANNPDPKDALRNLFTIRICLMVPTTCVAEEPGPP